MSNRKTEYIIYLYVISKIQRFLLQVAWTSDINQVLTPSAAKLLNFFI